MLLVGCKNKETVCKVNIENNNYKYTATYKIYYKRNDVTKIIKKEKYETSNKEVYNYLKNYRELELETYNAKYGGYKYDMKLDREVITINTTIDASKIDANKLVDDNVLSKYYVSKGKINISGLKKYYESKSAVCE